MSAYIAEYVASVFPDRRPNSNAAVWGPHIDIELSNPLDIVQVGISGGC